MVETITYNGRTFSFDGGGKEHVLGGEGPIMAKHLQVKAGEVFFDVGAADSAWTLYALASGATVYAFEPSQPQFKKLVQDVMVNDGFLERVHLFNMGLDREDCVKTLADWYVHLGGFEGLELTPDCHVPTRFLKLDFFLPELKRLDWIKMDVEAGEYYVLQGGAEAIKKFRPSLIIENHQDIVRMGDWMRANQIVEKIYAMLRDLDYDIVEDTHAHTIGRSFIVATPREKKNMSEDKEIQQSVGPMKKPKVTVMLGSNRQGGIDVSLAGLVGQTFKDFEVIFVDGRYHRRHKQVLEAVKRSGLQQPFFHVPNHRYGDGMWGNPCAGYNTGFMLAEGEILVMLLDYAYAPPDWLAHHVAHQAQPKVIMAPHEYRTLVGAVTKDGFPYFEFDQPTIFRTDLRLAIHSVLMQGTRFDEISIFKRPFTPEMLPTFPVEEGDAKCNMPTAPAPWDYFNTKNESFPLSAVLDVNGMDENYDLGRGPGDPDLGLRLSRVGLVPWVVNEAIVHCLNPRRILPNINIIIPEDKRLPPPFDDRWYIQDGYRYFDAVKANPQAIRAPNPYDLRERSKEIWGWRELSQQEEPVISKNVVPDRVYFQPKRGTKGSSNMTGPHMFDPRTQLNFIIWHQDPTLEAFIRKLIDTVKPDRWVETGTHMGWTSMWVAHNYPDLPIFTVEVDPDFYARSKENLAQYPNVTISHDSSPNFLAKLLPTIKEGMTIFWLDAHWWPPVPLREECRLVASLDRYICLLDDFSCWKPDFSGDTFFTIPPSGGDAYLNDISYVCSELGEHYWRPVWTPGQGNKGVGLFTKGTDYVPPPEYMRAEDLNGFIETRGRSKIDRAGEPGFVTYPLHPSSGRSVP
jgi:FkbM family methyltransferase